MTGIVSDKFESGRYAYSGKSTTYTTRPRLSERYVSGSGAEYVVELRLPENGVNLGASVIYIYNQTLGSHASYSFEMGAYCTSSFSAIVPINTEGGGGFVLLFGPVMTSVENGSSANGFKAVICYSDDFDSGEVTWTEGLSYNIIPSSFYMISCGGLSGGELYQSSHFCQAIYDRTVYGTTRVGVIVNGEQNMTQNTGYYMSSQLPYIEITNTNSGMPTINTSLQYVSKSSQAWLGFVSYIPLGDEGLYRIEGSYAGTDGYGGVADTSYGSSWLLDTSTAWKWSFRTGADVSGITDRYTLDEDMQYAGLPTAWAYRSDNKTTCVVRCKADFDVTLREADSKYIIESLGIYDVGYGADFNPSLTDESELTTSIAIFSHGGVLLGEVEFPHPVATWKGTYAGQEGCWDGEAYCFVSRGSINGQEMLRVFPDLTYELLDLRASSDYALKDIIGSTYMSDGVQQSSSVQLPLNYHQAVPIIKVYYISAAKAYYISHLWYLSSDSAYRYENYFTREEVKGQAGDIWIDADGNETVLTEDRTIVGFKLSGHLIKSSKVVSNG